MKIDISKYRAVKLKTYRTFCSKCGKKLFLKDAYIFEYDVSTGAPIIVLRWVCPNAFWQSRYTEQLSNHDSNFSNEDGEGIFSGGEERII